MGVVTVRVNATLKIAHGSWYNLVKYNTLFANMVDCASALVDPAPSKRCLSPHVIRMLAPFASMKQNLLTACTFTFVHVHVRGFCTVALAF